MGKELATLSAYNINGHHTPEESMRSRLADDEGLRLFVSCIPTARTWKIHNKFLLPECWRDSQKFTAALSQEGPISRLQTVIFTTFHFIAFWCLQSTSTYIQALGLLFVWHSIVETSIFVWTMLIISYLTWPRIHFSGTTQFYRL